MKSPGYDRSVPPGRPRRIAPVCATRFLRPFRGGVGRSRRTTGSVRLGRTPPVATALCPVRGGVARGGPPIRSWTLRSLVTVLLGRRSSFVPSGLGFFFSLFPVGLRRTAIGFRPCGALDRAMTPSPAMNRWATIVASLRDDPGVPGAVCAARFLRPFRGGVARSRRTTGSVRLGRTPPVATSRRPIRGESRRGDCGISHRLMSPFQGFDFVGGPETQGDALG